MIPSAGVIASWRRRGAGHANLTSVGPADPAIPGRLSHPPILLDVAVGEAKAIVAAFFPILPRNRSRGGVFVVANAASRNEAAAPARSATARVSYAR
jgi:hypothetical protein